MSMNSMKTVTNMNTTEKHLVTVDDLEKLTNTIIFFLGLNNMIFIMYVTYWKTNPPSWYQSSLQTIVCIPPPLPRAPFCSSQWIHTVPALWKQSIKVPITKKLCPTDNNDFRPLKDWADISLTGSEFLIRSQLWTWPQWCYTVVSMVTGWYVRC